MRRRSLRREDSLCVGFLHPDLGIGGAERLVVDAAVGLTSRGHTVTMYTSHHDPSHAFPETTNGTFPVHVYGDFLPRSVLGMGHVVCAILRHVYLTLCFIVADRPPRDVVFVDQISAAIPLLRLFTRAKVFFYCHHPDKLLTERKTLLKRIYRFPIDWMEEITTGMAHCVLVNSKYTESVFRHEFRRLAHVPVTVLYPSIKTTTRSKKVPSAPKDLHLGEEKHVLLSINRFERKKNLPLAIRALARLKQENNRLYARTLLVMAGGYDRRVTENVEHLEELRDLAQSLGVTSSVLFRTSISDAEREYLLHRCTAVVYTPSNEHFGIVPIEAMYAGRPVLACSSGGPVESVRDGDTGLLCEPTPEKFCQAMTYLISDPHRARAMGEAGIHHVETHFTLDAFTDGLVQEMKKERAKKFN